MGVILRKSHFQDLKNRVVNLEKEVILLQCQLTVSAKVTEQLRAQVNTLCTTKSSLPIKHFENGKSQDVDTMKLIRKYKSLLEFNANGQIANLDVGPSNAKTKMVQFKPNWREKDVYLRRKHADGNLKNKPLPTSLENKPLLTDATHCVDDFNVNFVYDVEFKVRFKIPDTYGHYAQFF